MTSRKIVASASLVITSYDDGVIEAVTFYNPEKKNLKGELPIPHEIIHDMYNTLSNIVNPTEKEST